MVESKLTKTSVLVLLFLVSHMTGCQKNSSDAPADSKSVSASGNGSDSKEITTKAGIQMVHVPAGQFMMGSTRGNPDEAPVHRVKISAFLMDKFEVTHEIFVKVQLPDPSHWQ